MPAPTNTTFLTAQAVTGNVMVTIPAADLALIGGDPSYKVYFKYTTVANERLIGIYTRSALAGSYDPRHLPYLGPASSPTHLFYDSNVNRSKMMPVSPLTEYFFEVIQSSTGVVPNSDLKFTVYNELGGGIPAGSILVSSDGEPFPMIGIDPATGTVHGHVQFINGEAGQQLPGAPTSTGHLAHTNKTTGGINFYDMNLNLVVAIPSGTIQTSSISRVTTDRVNRFYVQYQGINGSANAIIYRLSNLGVVLNSWSIPANQIVAEMAVSRDNTIMYLTQNGFSGVRRWDLVGSAFLSNIYTTAAGFTITTDLLYMADGSLIIPVRELASPFQSYIDRINASTGALINRIQQWDGASTSVYKMNRLAHALDETSIFVWERTFAGGGQTERFRRIAIADGTELSSTGPIDGFDNDGDNIGVLTEDLDPFGPMNSCPLMIAMTDLPTDVSTTSFGLFKIVPNRRLDHNGSINVGIPDPTWRTALLP